MKRNKYILLLATILIAAALWIPAKYDADNTDPEQPPVVEQATTITPPTPREFLKSEIQKQGLADRDFIILTEIIQCESGWSQFWADGTVKISSGNIGLAQINRWAHHEEYERLGLDPNDTFQNLTYAVILYKRGGITAWEKWSGHCFIPALAKKGIVL